MTTTESKTFGSVTTQSNQTIAGTDEVELKVPKTFAQMPLGFAIDAGELDFVYENACPMRIAVRPIDMHYSLDTSVTKFLELMILVHFVRCSLAAAITC
jgi:hypothetical protein